MRNPLASFLRWYRPRKAHTLLSRWSRNALVFLLPMLLLVQLFHRPWYDAITATVWTALIAALGEYGYFHVYGGTDKNYPNFPK